MQRPLWLNAVTAPLLFIGLVSVELASGEDLKQLESAYMASCNETVLGTKHANTSFCEEAFRTFVKSFQPESPIRMELFMGRRRYFDQYFQTTLFVKEVVDRGFFFSNTWELQGLLRNPTTPIEGLNSIYATRIVEGMSKYGVSRWCSHQRMVYVNGNCSENNVAKRAFWIEASERLGRKVSGNFFYLTKGGYYNPDSHFAVHELFQTLVPSSPAKTITVLNVLDDRFSQKSCDESEYFQTLRRIAHRLYYQCYNVYGDAEKPTQTLIRCLQGIMGNVMNHTTPAANRCYHKGHWRRSWKSYWSSFDPRNWY